jgi:hypothetical protein
MATKSFNKPWKKKYIMMNIAKLSVISIVCLITGCAAQNPWSDPCKQALKCITQNGHTEYRDPAATQEYGGSGTGVRYQAPTALTIYNTQGRRVGTIK